MEKTPLNSSVLRIISKDEISVAPSDGFKNYPTFAEKVSLQYRNMINDSNTTEKEKFAKFNLTDDRLDKFYFDTLTDLHPEL